MVPRQLIAQAEARVTGLTCLKNDIRMESNQINERIKALKQMIGENVRSLSNPQGLLTSAASSEYMAHFEAIDVGPIEQLLEKDTRNWERNLRVAKEDAERIEKELQTVIKERQEREKKRN